jgi:Na+-transporting methylmalonyl-CoA/oxaloacetate decarboxylase gamma subunit
MVTLGLVCLFLSVILLIMGLMAWGSMNMEKFEEEQPGERPKERTRPSSDNEEKHNE